VGSAIFPKGGFGDAYIWKDGVATDLGTLDGDCFSVGSAINSQGQVVGQSYSCASQTERTFLWENGSMIDLNSFVPAGSGAQWIEVDAINERGEIGGIGNPPGCPNPNDAACGHAFLLIPCDENHPGVEGCDYDTVDAGTAAQARPAQITESSAPARGAKFAPIELITRSRAMARRNQRFGALQK
jgi:probable HAF family extracellular repeat protein